MQARSGRRSLALLVAGGAAVAAAVLLGTGSERAASAAQPARPNVLLIETDDQTVESLRVMTNVQRLVAAQGTTFDNSFASFSLCCPSRALSTDQRARTRSPGPAFGNDA